jgi:hypothetical protein
MSWPGKSGRGDIEQVPQERRHLRTERRFARRNRSFEVKDNYPGRLQGTQARSPLKT